MSEIQTNPEQSDPRPIVCAGMSLSICPYEHSRLPCKCGWSPRNQCPEHIPGDEPPAGSSGYDAARCTLAVGHKGPHGADFHFWRSAEPWEGMGL